jgi:hypothetical protein
MARNAETLLATALSAHVVKKKRFATAATLSEGQIQS